MDNSNESQKSFLSSYYAPIPTQPHFYKKRVCIKFVQNNDEDSCVACKRPLSEHKEGTAEEYELYDCTAIETTDAFGDLIFPSSFAKKAKYIRIDKYTNPNNFLEYLYKVWALSAPKLIISITGGSRNFNLEKTIKQAFKNGLTKAAKTTNAWIISGGSNCGVMRLVGDAVKEDLQSGQLTVIGIASWGCLAFRDDLVRKSKIEDKKILDQESYYDVRYFPQQKPIEPSTFTLNANHSYFVLVDDGSVGKNGVELSFRVDLEYAIQKSEQIPTVLIVVEGGIGTLERISSALSQPIPIVIVAGSGGSADLLIEMWKDRKKFITDSNLLKHTIKVKLNNRLSDENVNRAFQLLIPILNKDLNELYINVFYADNKKTDLEPIILQALSRVNNDVLSKIELAIKWNQFKEAKDTLKRSRLPEDDPDYLEFSTDELKYLLEVALIENKPQFVNLILENDLDLRNFLTKDILMRLYQNQINNPKADEPFLIYLKGDLSNLSEITVEQISKFFEKRFGKFDPDFLPLEISKEKLIKEPELNLFLWAVLSNRIEIAKTFWRLGENQISNALIASRIYKFFADRQTASRQEFEKTAKEFEDLAIGVLQNYDKSSRNIISDVLILRYIKYMKRDVMELAVHCECEDFVSMPIVQTVIDHIWGGTKYDQEELTHEEKLLKKCQISINSAADYTLKNFNMCEEKSANIFVQFRNYLDVPYFRFVLNLVYYFLFLMFFSYTVLFTYSEKYLQEIETMQTIFKTNFSRSLNETLIEQNTTHTTIVAKNLTNMTRYAKNESNMINITQTTVVENMRPLLRLNELIILLWIIGLMAEEVRQFIFTTQVTSRNFYLKFKAYIKNEWNIFDFFGCIIFFIGFILSIAGQTTMARIVLSIDLIIWFIRSLHFCLLISALGPKLVMIRKMVDDLKYFLIIILNFVFAFGIALQAIMYPKTSFSLRILVDIFSISYWPIFGQLDLLEKLNECSEKGAEAGEECINDSAVFFSYFILMFYMIISSVLLLNLLIALFSSTFEAIQSKSDVIWKNQRYNLICEYINFPILPPPLNLIIYSKLIYEYFWPKEEQTNEDINSNEFLLDYEQKCAEKLLRELSD